MRVLIIDDEEDSQKLLTAFFQSEGFAVALARTSKEGLYNLKSFDPDLVVLDVRLPEMSGEEVCQRIRATSDVPIMMISAYARDNDDIIRGLNSGADDYLPKPLDYDLLKARVDALLRRSTKLEWRDDHPAYVDTHLVIDLNREQVRVGGQPTKLSPLEFRLLVLLVRNISQAVPSLEIVERLWPTAPPDEYIGYVHTYVKRLRDIIEPNPKKPVYIITEHGLGYRFVPQSLPVGEGSE